MYVSPEHPTFVYRDADVRVLIVRRCKQAVMYRRYANAVSMAAIHARYRSHHKAA